MSPLSFLVSLFTFPHVAEVSSSCSDDDCLQLLLRKCRGRVATTGAGVLGCSKKAGAQQASRRTRLLRFLRDRVPWSDLFIILEKQE